MEPTDRFAVHYPICWNTIAALPVTLARTWQNGPVDQLRVVSLTKEFRQYIFEPILFSLYCHLLNSFNGISYHYYDDVRLYFSVKQDNLNSFSYLIDDFTAITNGMSLNFLRLNPGKTGVPVFSSDSFSKKVHRYISFHATNIK